MMSRHKVTICLYSALSGDRGSVWTAQLESAGRERLLGEVCVAGNALELEQHALSTALSALRVPCAVDCFQRQGAIKALLQQARGAMSLALCEQIERHALQWYWWPAEPGNPQYETLRCHAETLLRDRRG